jgi:type I restriction enzyme S subunit
MIYNNSKYNEHWQIMALNDLGVFKRGKSKHRPRNDKQLFVEGIYPLVQTGEISNANLYIRNHSTMYNEFGLKQSKLWDKNTLCITIAANIAETALLGYPMCFPDSVVGFNAYPKISSELFMHYVFTYIKKAIQNSASGSIQDNINIDYLTSLKFRIPEKKYQDKVVKILSALDSKIELNNRINAELEAMAKTLYDYWFVQFDFPFDFAQGKTNANGKPYKSSGGKMVWNEELKREIPEGWEVKSIEECCIIVDCLHSKKPESKFESQELFLLQLENLLDNGLIDISKKYFVSQNDYKAWTSRIEVKENDILITNAGRVAATAQIPKEIITGIGRNITAIRPVSISPTYLFQSFRGFDILKQIKSNTDSGAFFQSFNVKGIKRLKFLIPEKIVENKFEQFSYLLRRKRELNLAENQKLTELRDWLLPMLMNGQVKVMDEMENELSLAAEPKIEYGK